MDANELVDGIFCEKPDKLSYDEACLSIVSQNNEHPVGLYRQYEECFNCTFKKWAVIPPEGELSLVVKTTDTLSFHLQGHSDSCSKTFLFEQHGIYGWNITNKECTDIYVIKQPDDAYLPLYILLGNLVIIPILYMLLKGIFTYDWSGLIYRRSVNSNADQSQAEDAEAILSSEPAPLVQSELIPGIRRIQETRVKSLDTFRGLVIILMIFVNYGGGKYWFFKHSSWNGLTVADLVFPWFAWIMGIGIALFVRSKLRSGAERVQIISRIASRTKWLLLLGIFASNIGNNNVTTLRIPGVLQRLAISYMVVTFLEAAFMKRQPSFQYGRLVIIHDELESWIQRIVIVVIVCIHTAILFRLDVPGCPKGYLGPGGDHDNGLYRNCTGGATGYIDRTIFGLKHIYQHPTSARVYNSTIPFDPEGVLGVLTTIATVYFGVIAGRIILCYNCTSGRLKRWLYYALLTGVIAGYCCDWSKEYGVIPINKNLWSLSFVLATSSMAFVVFSIIYLLVDHWGVWSGVPFTETALLNLHSSKNGEIFRWRRPSIEIYGRLHRKISPFLEEWANAIVIFLGHELTRHTFPWSWTPLSDTKTHTEFLVMTTVGTAIWVLIAVILHKKDVIISV